MSEPPFDPITMREAVGYPAIESVHRSAIEKALVLKHERLFLATDQRGDIAPPGHCSLGLFHDDSRILSHYALRVRGDPPSLLSSQAIRTYSGQVDLAVNDLAFGGDPWDPKNAIHIRRELLLTDRMIERLTLHNYLTTPIDYWIHLDLGCDFADIFEVRGWMRPERGQFFAPRIAEDRGAVTFAYRGRDGKTLRSVVRFRDPPDELAAAGASWRFLLGVNAHVELEWEVQAEHELIEPRALAVGRLDERRGAMEECYRIWRGQCTQWVSDSAQLDVTLRQATDDLRALYVEVDGEYVISAGIPWYSTVFGRDAIIASLQTLPLNPRIAVDTLRYLARRQGSREDPYTEEQPGKILHELRRGEMARSGEIPHVPYYGTVDATPLWLVLLHETWRWTGDAALVRSLLPHAERALAWIDRYGDADGDGFVEYRRTSDRGLANQGWKDSGDGVCFPDGRRAEPPIALVEVQGYVYDAKTRMAELFREFGQEERAEALQVQASRLHAQILERFWLDDLGTFALALDGQKQPVPTITSNAGHLLWSRVPRPEQGVKLRERLLDPDLFSGWGIRTLSAAHPVFNPMSYHNGSVWPHDNAIIVLGLARSGHARGALPVVRALYEAAALTDFHRLPELFCGMRRAYGMRPVDYPVSCSPQAWASGAMFMLLQAMLGLIPEAPARVLHIQDPVLPDFLDELTLTGLTIGGSQLSLQFRRHGARTLANLLAISGEPMHVRIELC
jgi:glycogen debranching enzyme